MICLPFCPFTMQNHGIGTQVKLNIHNIVYIYHIIFCQLLATTYNLSGILMLCASNEKILHTNWLHLSKCMCITQEHLNLLLVQMLKRPYQAYLFYHSFISTEKPPVSNYCCYFFDLMLGNSLESLLMNYMRHYFYSLCCNDIF